MRAHDWSSSRCPDPAAFCIRVPAPVTPFRRLIELRELRKFLKETPGSRVTHCVTNFLRREQATSDIYSAKNIVLHFVRRLGLDDTDAICVLRKRRSAAESSFVYFKPWRSVKYSRSILSSTWASFMNEEIVESRWTPSTTWYLPLLS